MGGAQQLRRGWRAFLKALASLLGQASRRGTERCGLLREANCARSYGWHLRSAPCRSSALGLPLPSPWCSPSSGAKRRSIAPLLRFGDALWRRRPELVGHSPQRQSKLQKLSGAGHRRERQGSRQRPMATRPAPAAARGDRVADVIEAAVASHSSAETLPWTFDGAFCSPAADAGLQVRTAICRRRHCPARW